MKDMKSYTELNKLQRDIREKLIKRASEGGFYTYTELDEDLGYPYNGLKNSSFTKRMGTDLEVISRYEMGNGRPLLSAIVVRKGKDEPESGFYKMAIETRKLKIDADKTLFAIKEQNKVHEYWGKHIDEALYDMKEENEGNVLNTDNFPVKTENADKTDEDLVEKVAKNPNFFIEGILNNPDVMIKV